MFKYPSSYLLSISPYSKFLILQFCKGMRERTHEIVPPEKGPFRYDNETGTRDIRIHLTRKVGAEIVLFIAVLECLYFRSFLGQSERF